MRKLLVVLGMATFLACGSADLAEAKVTEEQIQEAGVILVGFFNEEIQSEADAIRLFEQADRNGNGEITFAEFKKALKPFNLGIKSAVLKQLFLLVEQTFGNGDKKISEAEFLDAVVALL